MKDERIVTGSVVQVNDSCGNFSYCLVLVTDIRDWGILGGVQIPGQGFAFVRLKWEQVVYVGQAAYAFAFGENI